MQQVIFVKDEMLNENWLPTPINQIRTSLIFKCKDVLKNNISYNLQYLEYIMHIDNVERENKQYSTTVIMKMRYKSFVIVSMGIIESIFISLLEENKLLPYDYRKVQRKEIKIDENNIKVSYIKRKNNKFKRLNFDEIIDLIEKNGVLKIETSNYALLTELKSLRNKVHLEKANSFLESDYNSFDHIIYTKAKYLLYNILKSSNITSNMYNLFLEKFK